MSSRQRIVWLPFRTKDLQFDRYEPIDWKRIAAVKFNAIDGAEVWELTADGITSRGLVRERSAVQLLRKNLARNPQRWIEAAIDVEHRFGVTETVYVNARAITNVTMPNESIVSERYFHVELRGGQKFGTVSGEAFTRLKETLEATTRRLSAEGISDVRDANVPTP